LAAFDGELAAHAAAPADLDHVSELALAGRLADHAGIDALALLHHPVEHLLGAVDGDTFLVAGDQQADRAAEVVAAAGEETGHSARERSDGALHVRCTAPVELAIDDLGRERIDRPALEVAWRYHVRVSGEAEMRAARAYACVEVVDRVGIGRFEAQRAAGK